MPDLADKPSDEPDHQIDGETCWCEADFVYTTAGGLAVYLHWGRADWVPPAERKPIGAIVEAMVIADARFAETEYGSSPFYRRKP